MVPPKGITKWKTKFFYIKAAAICAKLTFRNVTDTIITETISVPKVDTVDWFPRLRIIVWKKLINSQLWVLRMMLGRMSRKARLVVREKVVDAPIWRIFDTGFKGKVEVVACADGEEGFNFTIRDNFRIPDREAMEAELPQGKDPDAAGVPKKHVEKGVRFRKPEKRMSRLLFLLWCRRWQGLGVPGGGTATGGSAAGSKPADDKKKCWTVFQP
ncbi:hypothetical protein Hanom_Chr02g00107751 [Helianthus anomalus]